MSVALLVLQVVAAVGLAGVIRRLWLDQRRAQQRRERRDGR